MNTDTRGLNLDGAADEVAEPKRIMVSSTPETIFHCQIEAAFFAACGAFPFIGFVSAGMDGFFDAMVASFFGILMVLWSAWLALHLFTIRVNQIMLVDPATGRVRFDQSRWLRVACYAKVRHIEIHRDHAGAAVGFSLHRDSALPMAFVGIVEPESVVREIAACLPDACPIRDAAKTTNWKPWWHSLPGLVLLPLMVVLFTWFIFYLSSF